MNQVKMALESCYNLLLAQLLHTPISTYRYATLMKSIEPKECSLMGFALLLVVQNCYHFGFQNQYSNIILLLNMGIVKDYELMISYRTELTYDMLIMFLVRVPKFKIY
ncbi:hypothetical protein AAZV13_18G086100 [Glycine max]